MKTFQVNHARVQAAQALVGRRLEAERLARIAVRDGGLPRCFCGATTRRRFLQGWRCPAHTPAAEAGRPEITPDPTRTVDGLRRRALEKETTR